MVGYGSVMGIATAWILLHCITLPKIQNHVTPIIFSKEHPFYPHSWCDDQHDQLPTFRVIHGFKHVLTWFNHIKIF